MPSGTMKRNSGLLQLGLLVLLHASLISAQLCNTQAVDSDGRMFQSSTTGVTQMCRRDFVYELSDQAGCGQCGIIKYGYAMSDPCLADVEITFANRRVADARFSTWIRSRGVAVMSGVPDTTDGFVGVFDGVSSSIEIPLFEFSELGARVEITIRYKEDANLTTDMGLLSNSGDESVFPTLAIAHSNSRNEIAAALNTTGGIFREFSVPIPEDRRNQWKTITFDYNALASEERGRLILEDPRRIDTDMVMGNIRALQMPILIGRGAFVDNFKGQIDFIRIARCSPVTQSTIPGPGDGPP